VATGRILIVNDEVRAASELQATLNAFGYEVAGVASSGREAIHLVAQTSPDLVLMDIAPEASIGGIEAAEAIRKSSSIPIICLIANTVPDGAAVRGDTLTEPFDQVTKPYADRELRITIEMALLKEAMKRQAHELEDRFFNVSIDMLCLLDFGGYFKRLNPAWESVLGFTREELMSKPFIEFVHPDDRARTLNQNRTVRGGGQARSFENRYLCKDGSHRWLLWNAAPDFDEKVIYSVARDITDRKKAEEEREKLVRELRAALAEVKSLQTILPICSYCKKIRDDENYWQSVEGYISRHTNTTFSHSICPSCYESQVTPQLDDMNNP
jgi:PAS domain S-box-containing protein